MVCHVDLTHFACNWFYHFAVQSSWFMIELLNRVPRTGCKMFCMFGVRHNFSTEGTKFSCKRDVTCVNSLEVNLAGFFKDFILV